MFYRPEIHQGLCQARKRSKMALAAAPQSGAGVKAVMSGDTFGGYKIEGVSIAGQETSIIVPEVGVVFDTGRCPQKSCFQPHVLISHAHLDHIGGLPFIISTRQMHGLEPAKVALPEELVEGTNKMLDTFAQLGGAEWQRTLTPCKLGDEWKIKPQIIATPFRTEHRVPSLGYLLMLEKKKLKPQYLGLPGKEIKRLKDEGNVIDERIRIPEIGFTGDTTIEFLEGELVDGVLDAKLLIIELTILNDLLAPEETKERGHIHLDHFLENAHRFKNNAILFIHLSPRYSRTEVLDILNRRLPESLKNRCGVLLENFK